MSFVIEYPNILLDILCEDIIELFNEQNECQSTTIMNIPKNSKEWDKIERFIYKTILIKLNEYKISMLNKNSEIINELSKKLKLPSFTIQKYNDAIIPNKFNRENSRKNVVTFVLFLNNPEGGELVFKKIDKENLQSKEYTVYPESGKLIVFPDDINHLFKINGYKGDYYVISNQISYF